MRSAILGLRPGRGSREEEPAHRERIIRILQETDAVSRAGERARGDHGSGVLSGRGPAGEVDDAGRGRARRCRPDELSPRAAPEEPTPGGAETTTSTAPGPAGRESRSSP